MSPDVSWPLVLKYSVSLAQFATPVANEVMLEEPSALALTFPKSVPAAEYASVKTIPYGNDSTCTLATSSNGMGSTLVSSEKEEREPSSAITLLPASIVSSAPVRMTDEPASRLMLLLSPLIVACESASRSIVLPLEFTTSFEPSILALESLPLLRYRVLSLPFTVALPLAMNTAAPST